MEVARSKISMQQISLIIEVVTRHSQIAVWSTELKSVVQKGVPSSSDIDIIDEETESDETPPVKKMLRSTHVKISQLVNKMCSQQTCSKLVNKL
jgi:curli biogenesis system outer membrane secretion channel CsgG